MTTPEWLTQRSGALKLGPESNRWYVLFAGQPNYSVAAVPVGGKFGCAIRQTINGQRVDCQGTFASGEEAIKAGLEELRNSLGWGKHVYV